MVVVPQRTSPTPPSQEGSTFPLSDGSPEVSVMGSLLLFLPHLVTCYDISRVSAVHSVIVWGS